MIKKASPALCVAVAAVLAGCPAPTATPMSAPSPMATSAPMAEGRKSSDMMAPGGSSAGRSAAAPEAMPASAGADEAAPVPPSQQQQQQALKAGAVDDNAQFGEYLKYRETYQGMPMRSYDVSERFVLRVVDAEGKAVSNASVTVDAASESFLLGKSYANGQLLFHPKTRQSLVQATSFSVTASKGANTVTKAFDRQTEGVWELQLPEAAPAPAPKLDVLFLLDATGSMGGEIRRLQSTLQTISDRIQALDGQPAVRFGLVSYRDQGDEYVTRKTDFTADLPAFQAALNRVEAAGGGDIPEDLESGLQQAVNAMSWDEGDTVRLVFVVADAAPHVDYPQSVPYTTSMEKAAQKGVKLYTVGASGLSKEGEYAMRQLAQGTMAQYLFITRGGDESSGGGGAASATVDKFQEGRLDDIVVDIVKAELGSLGQK